MSEVTSEARKYWEKTNLTLSRFPILAFPNSFRGQNSSVGSALGLLSFVVRYHGFAPPQSSPAERISLLDLSQALTTLPAPLDGSIN